MAQRTSTITAFTSPLIWNDGMIDVRSAERCSSSTSSVSIANKASGSTLIIYQCFGSRIPCVRTS